METALRLLGLVLFCLGIYLLFDLLAGFDPFILVGALLCFYGSHRLAPARDGRRDDAEWTVLDVIDIALSLPFRAVATALRGVWRIGGARDGGDVDL